MFILGWAFGATNFMLNLGWAFVTTNSCSILVELYKWATNSRWIWIELFVSSIRIWYELTLFAGSAVWEFPPETGEGEDEQGNAGWFDPLLKSCWKGACFRPWSSACGKNWPRHIQRYCSCNIREREFATVRVLLKSELCYYQIMFLSYEEKQMLTKKSIIYFLAYVHFQAPFLILFFLLLLVVNLSAGVARLLWFELQTNAKYSPGQN